ncbi:unnamed protein product [Effrenium voratum]|nr:unnamed protein product [Effrenium voratum]
MALKRTAENGLADRLQVVEAFVSDQPGACRMSSQQAGQDWVVHQNWQLTPGPAESGCQVVTLDEIFSGLGPLGEQDVLLRLHVDGRELQVLRSLTAVSRVARAAVALWPARDDSPAGQEAYAPEKVAQWLWGHGFRLRLVYSHEGLLAELKDEEAVWALQSRRVPTVDTMTLLAERGPRMGCQEDRRKKAVLLEWAAAQVFRHFTLQDVWELVLALLLEFRIVVARVSEAPELASQLVLGPVSFQVRNLRFHTGVSVLRRDFSPWNPMKEDCGGPILGWQHLLLPICPPYLQAPAFSQAQGAILDAPVPFICALPAVTSQACPVPGGRDGQHCRAGRQNRFSAVRAVPGAAFLGTNSSARKRESGPGRPKRQTTGNSS